MILLFLDCRLSSFPILLLPSNCLEFVFVLYLPSFVSSHLTSSPPLFYRCLIAWFPLFLLLLTPVLAFLISLSFSLSSPSYRVANYQLLYLICPSTILSWRLKDTVQEQFASTSIHYVTRFARIDRKKTSGFSRFRVFSCSDRPDRRRWATQIALSSRQGRSSWPSQLITQSVFLSLLPSSMSDEEITIFFLHPHSAVQSARELLFVPILQYICILLNADYMISLSNEW